MTKTLSELITLIDEPNRSACLQMLLDHSDRFQQSPGSQTKHQAWPGGYIGHLEEIMNIAVMLHETMGQIRALPFSVSDACLVLFLHDLEKPFKYVEPKQTFTDDAAKENFIEGLIHEYRIILSNEQKNALKYVHGEGDDYHPTERIAGPLAAFVHICDTWSARIWFDFPKK